MKIQNIKDFIERPKLSMLDQEYIVPEQFKFLEPFLEKIKFTGKSSKYGKEYWKYLLLSDAAKKDEGSHFTPEMITNFVNQYIELNNFKFNSVIDFTSGIGAFLFAINNIKDIPKTFWDINEKSIDIAKVISQELKLEHCDFAVKDTLSLAKEHSEEDLGFKLFDKPTLPKYDLLVLNPPFNLDKTSNYDFVKLAIKMLSDNGKAFIVLPKGVLSNANKDAINSRKWMVENGYLEAIVDFEGGIFENTSIPTTMFIVSKRNTKWEKVKMYDLTDMKLPLVRKQTKINPLSGRKYYRDLKNYSLWNLKEHHHFYPHKDIEKDSYSFSIGRYKEILNQVQSKNYWWDNMKHFERLKWDDKSNNNWFAQVLKNGTGYVIAEIESLLKLNRNQHINSSECYNKAIKNPMKFSVEMEQKIINEDIEVPKQFRIECQYIKNCLIELLVG